MKRQIWTLLFVTMVACTKQEAVPTDGGTGFTTPVDPKKTLGNLNSADQMLLCSEFTAYANSNLLPDECRHAAVTQTYSAAQNDPTLTDSDLGAYCASHYAACVSSVDSGSMSPGADASASGGLACDYSKFQSSCSATVGDLTACVTALDATYKASPACDVITRTGLADLASDGGFTAGSPPSCALVDKCSTAGDGGP